MEDAIKEILGDIFDVDAREIGEAFASENVELWDSLNHLRMVTAIEEKFGVSFTMEEIGQMTTYTAILSALRKHGR